MSKLLQWERERELRELRLKVGGLESELRSRAENIAGEKPSGQAHSGFGLGSDGRGKAGGKMKIIAKRIHALRLQQGITQTQLAERCKWMPSLISHYETGRRSPSVSNLVKLSKALGASTDYLLGLSSGEFNPRPEATLDQIGRALHVLGIKGKLVGA